MPGTKSTHTAKWDRCIKKVKAKGEGDKAYAFCSSSIKDGGVKPEHQKRDKKDYYANRKKKASKEKKNEMIITFVEYLTEAIMNADDLEGGKRKINLRGPEGNAYNILGVAQQLCRQLKDVDPEKYDFEKIQAEMKSGDYDNLIKVFDEYFGDFVDLYK